ncbi:non-ribosomal peptide synthetase [Actinomadura fibrosa]|uniref:Phenyloxazoline synthase MbtB n=1 Tax=Actinomadura fibrosa TaxID=111802 RepID=A0ABW2Y0D1_9ACTN|nr:non-ribosomal peptide synthetase [Actinomadura fibrosa]
MEARDLLVELRERGIRLRLTERGLEVVAAAGALTPRLRDDLREHRDDLVELVRRAGPPQTPPVIVPDPGRRYEPFALTDIQHAYWVGRNPAVELGGVSAHSYMEVRGHGLDPDRLTESLRGVIDRHDMLRAVVLPDGRQRILAEVPPYDIAVDDLRGLDPEEQAVRLAATRAELDHQVRPADRWPLFEVRMSRLDDRTAHLHFSFDLLIVDALSVGMVVEEWRRRYLDPSWDPGRLPLSFRDCVIAEQELRTGDRYRDDEGYWLDRLDSLPPAPALPLAAHPAQVERTAFARRTARLPADRWAAIQQAGRARGLTPATVLMTAFTDVLRAWTAQPAMTLNLTLFNRPALHPRISEIVGDFTSVLLLAVDEPAADDAFTDRVRRLGRRFATDLGHAAYGGVRLLRERARRTGNRPGAAMPVVFTSLLGLDSYSGLRFFGDLVEGVSQTPQVCFDHQVAEDHGALVINWDTVEALYPAELLDDMFAAYQDLLRRLGAGGAAWDEPGPAVELPRWQALERLRVNDSAAVFPDSTLNELVEARAERQPDAIAVICREGVLRYDEVVAGARRLARRLLALDVPPGSLVGVVLDKGLDQVVAVLGVVMAGAAYLPIDPQWPAARRDDLLAQGRATVAVTDVGHRDGLDWPDGLSLVTLADAEMREVDPGPLPCGPEPGDLAYVIFTSGSTGRPKGVMIDHRGAVNTIHDINARFGVGPGDRVLALSALSFDLSVYDIFGTLAAGGAIVMPSPAGGRDPGLWTGLIRRHRVTIWNSVPALMRAWLDAAGPDGPDAGLRLALLSGDWIPVDLPDAVRARCPGIEVVSLGGATEASIWSVHFPIGDVAAEWTSIPYGRPLANQTLHVYDSALEPRPVWCPGEIYIGGTGVARGYWADPELTGQRFGTHPVTGARLYRTGDLGRYLPGGDIEFLGRQDSQIKINGYRVELGEISAALRSRPEVADAVVTFEPNPATDRRQLVAYVVLQPPGSPIDAGALREALTEAIPSYMVPRHYLAVDRVPLSANGKVDPARLPSPWTDSAAQERVPPRDAAERFLYDLWSDALGHGEFGVTDDFFELGGDSLHAVRILGRISAKLTAESAEDALQALFDRPTIEGWAGALRGLGTLQESEPA